MSIEALLVAGYSAFLLLAAVGLELLSVQTHRRAQRYRTAGFDYDDDHDHWVCPEGQDLWPHEFDHERRLVRYRAKAHICNGCPKKDACTDSSDGREITRALDPWPHSEAGRFHRGLSLVLVTLALLVLVVGGVRNHAGAEPALLLSLLVCALVIGRWLVRDFRAHPANFPDAAPAHGLGLTVTGADGRRPRSKWASQNRPGG